MRVLVTGGAGFLGSHLVPSLLQRGDEVIVQDILAPELAFKIKDWMPRIEYRWKGVVDTDPASLKGVDVVVHLATQGDVPLANSSPRYTYQLNTDAMLSLLTTLKETKTPLLAMSTENVYGRVPDERLPAKEDEPFRPKNGYAASKVAMEALCHAYAYQYNVPVGIIRSSTLFGERSRPRQVIAIFMRQALKGEPITIEGDGSQTRDFNYAGNMVQAILTVTSRIARASQEFDVWNIGSGEETSLKQLVETILKVTKSSSKIVNKPWRLGEEGRLCISIEKAKRELGYRPSLGLEEGLKRAADWALSSGV